MFATRFKVGLDSVPIPEFAVYHDPFFDPFPNPFCVLVLSHETKVASTSPPLPIMSTLIVWVGQVKKFTEYVRHMFGLPSMIDPSLI